MKPAWKEIDWSRCALNALAAFLTPIGAALVAGSSLIPAAKGGLGLAVAVVVGFLQKTHRTGKKP